MSYRPHNVLIHMSKHGYAVRLDRIAAVQIESAVTKKVRSGFFGFGPEAEVVVEWPLLVLTLSGAREPMRFRFCNADKANVRDMAQLRLATLDARYAFRTVARAMKRVNHETNIVDTARPADDEAPDTAGGEKPAPTLAPTPGGAGGEGPAGPTGPSNPDAAKGPECQAGPLGQWIPNGGIVGDPSTCPLCDWRGCNGSCKPVSESAPVPKAEWDKLSGKPFDPSQLHVGAFVTLRNGMFAGPLRHRDDKKYPWAGYCPTSGADGLLNWTAAGTYYHHPDIVGSSEYDIVAVCTTPGQAVKPEGGAA